MLTKPKLNSIEALISEALIDLNISHDEFVLKNDCPEKIRRYERRNQKLKPVKVLRRF